MTLYHKYTEIYITDAQIKHEYGTGKNTLNLSTGRLQVYKRVCSFCESQKVLVDSEMHKAGYTCAK